MSNKITQSEIDYAFNTDGHQKSLIKKLLLRIEELEQQVNSVDLADVVKSWSEIKEGDEFTVKCKVVKGKFELNLD